MLILPATLQSQILAEARTAHPAECCGLMEGVRGSDAIRVTALHPTANLSADPLSGFEIDPAVHFRLLRTLRGTGREVVGCYHSHPNGRPEPSPRDRANGCEAGFVWIIVAVKAEITLAAFQGPQFLPLPIRG
jgi:proteasome lid subunit RPN8/RPN11